MALRDVVALTDDIADDGYLEIKPTGTLEWSIQNVYGEGQIQLWRFNADGSFMFAESLAGVPALFSWVDFKVTATEYMRVVNVSGDTAGVGYDGVVTHIQD